MWHFTYGNTQWHSQDSEDTQAQHGHTDFVRVFICRVSWVYFNAVAVG